MTQIILSDSHIQRSDRSILDACPLILALQESIGDDVLLCRGHDPFSADPGLIYGFYRQLTKDETTKDTVFVSLPRRCQTFRRIWEYGHGGHPDLPQFATRTGSGQKVMHSWDDIIRPFEFAVWLPDEMQAQG